MSKKFRAVGQVVGDKCQVYLFEGESLVASFPVDADATSVEIEDADGNEHNISIEKK